MSFMEGVDGSTSAIGLGVVAVTAFLGWRIGTAQDAVRVQYQADQIADLTATVCGLRRELNSESRSVASSLASISTSLKATADLLTRLERRLERLEGHVDGR